MNLIFKGHFNNITLRSIYGVIIMSGIHITYHKNLSCLEISAVILGGAGIHRLPS